MIVDYKWVCLEGSFIVEIPQVWLFDPNIIFVNDQTGLGRPYVLFTFREFHIQF